ncbi:helix-turn-helix domain-containing protein [Streptomyces sp. NPDC093589]|uniref:helix-turn-helix domain-containing protein n=1 Tax=Streptomyces sp. NPDC093589 TaxID=3366043 RepID=UPI0037F249D6
MSDASREAGCGFCGKAIVQRSGGGRPRDYCDESHRRHAQRKRDRELRVAVPRLSHRFVAAELDLHAGELVAACFSDVPLSVLLELVAKIADDAECAAAAAVFDERCAGRTWEQIGVADNSTGGKAKARWGGARLAQRLTVREPAPWAGPWYGTLPGGSATVTHPDRRARQAAAGLGRALRTLREQANSGLDDVASEAGMPVFAVHWVLEGQVVVPWTAIYTLAHLLGGQRPGDLRLLWENATNFVPRLPDPPRVASRLAAGLRGARLAAGYPPAAAVYPPALTEAQAEAVFEGRLVPEWSVLCEVLLWLGADPEPFKELWAANRAPRGPGQSR